MEGTHKARNHENGEIIKLILKAFPLKDLLEERKRILQ